MEPTTEVILDRWGRVEAYFPDLTEIIAAKDQQRFIRAKFSYPTRYTAEQMLDALGEVETVQLTLSGDEIRTYARIPHTDSWHMTGSTTPEQRREGWVSNTGASPDDPADDGFLDLTDRTPSLAPPPTARTVRKKAQPDLFSKPQPAPAPRPQPQPPRPASMSSGQTQIPPLPADRGEDYDYEAWWDGINRAGREKLLRDHCGMGSHAAGEWASEPWGKLKLAYRFWIETQRRS